MNKRVVITGMGTITPIGNSVETFKNNLFNGVCGIDRLSGLDEWNLSIKVAGQIKDFDAKALGMDAASIRRSDLFNQYGNSCP